MTASRLVSTVALVLAGGLFLTACSSAPSPTERPEPAAASAAPSASPTPSPTPTSFMVDDPEEWTMFGPFVIRNNHSMGDVDTTGVYTVRATTVWQPDGEAVLSAERLLPGEDVLREVYSPIEGPDGPLVAGLFTVRVPASGLDPERFEGRLLAIDPATVEVVKETVVAKLDSDDLLEDLGSAFGSVNGSGVTFSWWQERDDRGQGRSPISVSVDAVSGEKLWEREGIVEGGTLQQVAVLARPDQAFDIYADEEECSSATVVDNDSGDSVLELDAGRLDEMCFDLRPTDLSGSGVRSNVSEHGRFLRFMAEGSAAGRITDVDTVRNEVVDLPRDVAEADPRTDLVVELLPSSPALSVVDLATGEAVFELDAERAERLSARPLSLVDGVLYLETTDGVISVDVTSGGDATGTEVDEYPIRASAFWTLFSDGTLERVDQASD